MYFKSNKNYLKTNYNNFLFIELIKYKGLKIKLVAKKEIRKPINKPIYPKYFNRMMERIIPNKPCIIERMVGVLFNLSADKKTTDTLSKMIRQVKIKYK